MSDSVKYSNSFITFNWVAIVLIYLVVIAGSFVRITGSGMGCPDWPKCFDQWVPPTHESQVPNDYEQRFVEQRKVKVERFARMIEKLGMSEVAVRLINDPELSKEEPFNVKKTWTEYINRLLGFLAGNGLLIVFIWISLFYRNNKKIWLISFLNLIFIAFQAWFGSIVVASNLVPWTITLHLFFALVIIGLQLLIIRAVSTSQQKNLPQSKLLKGLVLFCFLITFYQMFLGTQVRESIDELTRMGISRNEWTDYLGLSFFIHRSFSWLVLLLIGIISYLNETKNKFKIIRWSFLTLILGLFSGVLLAHFDMPGLVQTSHLLFASVLLAILFMQVLRFKSKT